MCRATVNGLQSLVRPEDVAALRGKTIAEVLPFKIKGPEEETAEEAAGAEDPVAVAEPVEPAEEPGE